MEFPREFQQLKLAVRKPENDKHHPLNTGYLWHSCAHNAVVNHEAPHRRNTIPDL